MLRFSDRGAGPTLSKQPRLPTYSGINKSCHLQQGCDFLSSGLLVGLGEQTVNARGCITSRDSLVLDDLNGGTLRGIFFTAKKAI
jgi:hypothetical protein